jgi:hypothetical protein
MSNGVFFDSKAFEKMPSHLHQLNSTTGMPESNNNLTTLNMGNPYSLE